MDTENSILTVEQKKKITISGVESVDAFSEEKILLTVAGQRVTLEGNGLKILSFSEGSKNFSASGEVRLIRYGSGKGRMSALLK